MKHKVNSIKLLLVLTGAIVSLLSCYLPDDCPEGINSLPMYGRIKKCAGQIEADNRFLKLCDEQYNGDRKAAAKYFARRGWDHYYQQKPDTAMFRFNQAWMLDSLNTDIYWGFANLTGMQEKYEESISLFKRAIELSPANSKIYESAANSYRNMFFKTKDNNYFKGSYQSFKKSR